MKRVIKFLIITLILFMFSCRYSPQDPEILTLVSKEYVIYKSDSMTIYMYNKEITGVTVPNIQNIAIPHSYKIPSKDEAKILHYCEYEEDGKQRNLCLDEEGVYWTFKYNGSGSITKAGNSTKYKITPIRVDKMIDDLKIEF